MYLPHFPKSINNEIPTKDFLIASSRLLGSLDFFGRVFMPLKFDMQRNIEKISRKFNSDRKDHATLQKFLTEEIVKKENVVLADAVLWLRRDLNMITLFFEFIVDDYENGNDSESLTTNLTEAYKIALEPYHGNVASALFHMLIQMIPKRAKLLKSITNGYEMGPNGVIKNMAIFTKRLFQNINALKKFYRENQVESHYKL